MAATTLGALGVNVDRSAALNATDANTEPVAPAANRRRPNVLLLMSDQHKRSCMGVAGDTTAITPNLDRLAQESVRFTSAYCANPVCAPSRASMLTGLYSHNLLSRSVLQKHGDSSPYSFQHKTMADRFHGAGYMTALIGKMHFLDAQTHGFDYKLQFNDWWQYLGPKVHLYEDEVGHPDSGAGLPQVPYLWREEGDPWKGHRQHDDRQGAVAVGHPSIMEEQDHFESFVARESIRFLENQAPNDEPFFLISSFLKPHEPFMPAKRFAEMFQPEQMKLSPTWGKADLQQLPKRVQHSIEFCPPTPELGLRENDPSEARKRMASYYGNLAQTDDCVGQVLGALTRLGLDHNTIVIYTSDHGEMLGDLGLWDKFQFYEGSCGVPLMVRVPGGAPAVCDTPVSLISLSATLTDLCDVPSPGPSDGKSFAPLVRQPQSRADHGPVFAEYSLGNKGAKYMIRDGDYKYTYWTHDTPELYNLHSDPQEMHNLAARPEHQATVERLKKRLFEWHRPEEI